MLHPTLKIFSLFLTGSNEKNKKTYKPVIFPVAEMKTSGDTSLSNANSFLKPVPYKIQKTRSPHFQ